MTSDEGEPKRAGGRGSPVSVGKIGSAVYMPGATVGPRTLSDFQFVWILRGSAEWWSTKETMRLRPGQLLLVRPGTRDRWQWDRSQPTTHGYVHFSLTGSWRPPTPGGWPVLRVTGEDDPLPATLRYLLRLDTTSSIDLDLAAELVRFVLVVFARGSGAQSAPALPVAVDSVVEHVHEVWAASGVARALSLDELAAAAAVSPGHLCRVFRHRFGVGPVTAFELLRLARAATLLSRSDLPIAAIARSCGFADPDHFSHRFRRVYETPPGRYRHTSGGADPSAPLAATGLLPIAARLLH